MKPSRECYIPSHPTLFVVEFRDGEFSSSLKTVKNFQAGETITLLEGLTKGPRAYTSVQCGIDSDDHVELNSDLVYVNHSCEPNVAFDLSSPDPSQWHVRALKNLDVGTRMTFFYPSTEWDMDQAFDCQCCTDSCLGRIQGAAYLPSEELKKQEFVSSYIWALVNQRDNPKPKTGSVVCTSCGYGLSARGDLWCGCRPATTV